MPHSARLPLLTIEHTRPFMVAATTAAVAAVGLRLAPALLGAWLHWGEPRLARIDAGVMVLFVPLCVLIFAMLFEVIRLLRHGELPDAAPPQARAIPHWQDAAL